MIDDEPFQVLHTAFIEEPDREGQYKPDEP
jgi:hypothetical protein